MELDGEKGDWAMDMERWGWADREIDRPRIGRYLSKVTKVLINI